MSPSETLREVEGAPVGGPQDLVPATATSRRRRPRQEGPGGVGVVIAALVVAFVLSWVFFPDLITAKHPLRTSASDALQPPSTAHLFGTDELGRDIFARLVHGTALTLETSLLAVVIGLVGGSMIGLFAGYFGRWVDGLLMRIVDVLLSIPMLLLAMAIVTAIGFGSVPLALGVGIGMVGSVARVMRSEVLAVARTTYVDAERSMGAGTAYIVFRHVLPNAMGPVLVLAILDFCQAVLALAALSFLGFGTAPPAPEWGSLVAGGQAYLASAWWMCTLPGLTIAVFVVCVNVIARALQDRRPR